MVTDHWAKACTDKAWPTGGRYRRARRLPLRPAGAAGTDVAAAAPHARQIERTAPATDARQAPLLPRPVGVVLAFFHGVVREFR